MVMLKTNDLARHCRGVGFAGLQRIASKADVSTAASFCPGGRPLFCAGDQVSSSGGGLSLELVQSR